jgi:hypothetical protein
MSDIYIYTYLSTALQPLWTSAASSVSVVLLGRGISPSQGRYLHTKEHKHRVNAQTSMPRVGFELTAGEDGSCIRQRDHCDRHIYIYVYINGIWRNIFKILRLVEAVWLSYSTTEFRIQTGMAPAVWEANDTISLCIVRDSALRLCEECQQIYR